MREHGRRGWGMRRWVPVAGLCAVGVVACGGGPGDAATGTRADSAGVVVWTGPGADRSPEFRLERMGALAQPDTGWALSPDGVAVDRAGERIYVLDESTPRVLVFDTDGALLGERGRKGEGPGEYLAPTALDVGPRGAVGVMDPEAGGVHRWARGGSYVGRDPMPIPYWGPGFAVTTDGMVYTTAGGEETGTMTEALVRLSDSGADTLFTVTSRWTPLEMPCGRVPVPEVLARSTVWAGSGDRVVYASVPRYALRVLSAGSLETVYRRAVAPRAVSAAEAEATVAAGPLRFLVEACGMTASGVVRGAGFVEEVSPIVHLALGPAGRVWAVRGLGAEVTAIDVLDPELGYLGTFTRSDVAGGGSVGGLPIPAAFIDSRRFVAITESEWGRTLEFWQVAGGS